MWHLHALTLTLCNISFSQAERSGSNPLSIGDISFFASREERITSLAYWWYIIFASREERIKFLAYQRYIIFRKLRGANQIPRLSEIYHFSLAERSGSRPLPIGMIKIHVYISNKTFCFISDTYSECPLRQTLFLRNVKIRCNFDIFVVRVCLITLVPEKGISLHLNLDHECKCMKPQDCQNFDIK